MSLTAGDFLGVTVTIFPRTDAPVGDLKRLGAGVARWLGEWARRDGFRVDLCGIDHVLGRVDSLLAGELPDPVGLAFANAVREGRPRGSPGEPGESPAGLSLAEIGSSPFFRARHVSFQVPEAIHRLASLRDSLSGCLHPPGVERVVFAFLTATDLDSVGFTEIAWEV